MNSSSKDQATCDAPALRPESRRTWSRNLWRKPLPFLLAVLLMLTFVSFPPVPPTAELGGYEADASLSLILDYAHQQGLQFGTGHVYTYGPLGFLIFLYDCPEYAGLHMAVNLLLCTTVALGLCLLGSRLRCLWQCLLLAAFVWAAANIYPKLELVVDTGLLCFGLLCYVETGRRLFGCAAMLTILAAFSALAKNSFLFVASLSVALVTLDLFLRGRYRGGIAMLAGFAGTFFAGWILSGQDARHLGSFVVNALAMVRGYNSALGWEQPIVAGWVGLSVALLVLVLIIIVAVCAFEPQDRFRGWRRLFLLAWLGALCFAAWKHGFVRAHGLNMRMFFSLIAVLAVAVQALASDSRFIKRWSHALGLACCLSCLVALQWLFFEPLGTSLLAPFRAARYNLSSLLNPTGYGDRMNAVAEANRRGAQLPKIREIVGQARVDVFGRQQAYAIYNDLNYRPRPVPQSYAVCTAGLMRLNHQFYASENAPEFVLFELGALDRKFPALEDAWVLRDLLVNYERVASEGPFLLLKQRSVDSPRLTLLREATIRHGQKVELLEFGAANLWIEIVLESSWSGRLRQFFLRPPTVRLSAYNTDKKLLLRARTPASMLAAGFLASPLLVRTDDVQALYSGNSVTRPGAYSVDLLPGEEHYWQDEIRLKIYRIENPLGKISSGESIKPDPDSLSGATIEEDVTSTNPPALVAGKAPRPFTLVRSKRWRPGEPPPGNFQETLAFVILVVLPCAGVGLLVLFVRGIRRAAAPIGWRALIVGNGLVLFCLLSAALLGGEIYFRFVYDTTDSLGYTRVCERWVQRHWHVNQAGCRDNVEYHPRIQPGKRRVTFIGDSFTAGHGIKDVEDRFPNLLRQAHSDWEIHVLAYVGLDTGREAILLNRSLNQGYELDQVVLVYCLNDIGDLLPPDMLAAAQSSADLANDAWFVRNSYLINFLYHRYKAFRNPAFKDYFPFVREAYKGPLWEQQKERLKAFRDRVQSKGGRLSVITFPFLHALGPNYEYRDVHNRLDEFWRELRVPHLDLLRVYAREPPKQLTVNPYDAHPNEHASQLAAPLVDKFLTSIFEGTETRSGVAP